jgi:predicted small lipoprotein YifL
MKRLLSSPSLLVILLLVLAACGGGGSGGPTEPPPEANVNVQGTWVGTASTVSARGTCLAEGFLPVSVPVVWTMRQSGVAVVAVEGLNNAQVCAFTGTVRGSTVTFLPNVQNSDGRCSLQNLACSGPRAVRIDLLTGPTTFTGTVNGNRMRIDSLSVWRVTETSTGNVLGEYQVTGRQDLQR